MMEYSIIKGKNSPWGWVYIYRDQPPTTLETIRTAGPSNSDVEEGPLIWTFSLRQRDSLKAHIDPLIGIMSDMAAR